MSNEIKKEQVQSGQVSSALARAREIIEEAEKKAERIIREAREEAETVEEEAYKIGYVEGKKKSIDAVLDTYKAAEVLSEQATTEVAKLALEVSKKIIEKEIQSGLEVAREIAERVVRDSHISGNIKITVNPKDVSQIEKSVEALSKELPGSKIEVANDDSITRGGCKIESDVGEFDATIEILHERIALIFKL